VAAKDVGVPGRHAGEDGGAAKDQCDYQGQPERAVMLGVGVPAAMASGHRFLILPTNCRIPLVD
jgi:hypothetical protein